MHIFYGKNIGYLLILGLKDLDIYQQEDNNAKLKFEDPPAAGSTCIRSEEVVCGRPD